MSSSLEAAFEAGDPGAIAVARARAYRLFAELVAHGVTEATRAHVLGFAELAAALDAEGLGAADPGVLEALAVEHERVLGREVFPWASVYLDPTGQPGGEITARCADRLAELGFRADPGGAEADHLAVLLDGLAFASSAEAEAHRDGRPDVAQVAAEARGRLVAELLSPWFPLFRRAVEREGSAFITALLALVGALLDGEAEATTPRGPTPDVELPDLATVMADPKAGLRAIAEHLAVPARSGVVLSRSAITELGRSVGLPRGFGSRRDQVEALLRGAAEHDQLPALVDRLVAVCDRAAEVAGDRARATRDGLLALRAAAPAPD